MELEAELFGGFDSSGTRNNVARVLRPFSLRVGGDFLRISARCAIKARASERKVPDRG